MRKQNIVIRSWVLDAAGAQRIKATPGITGYFRPRVHIDGGVRHLNILGCNESNFIPEAYLLCLKKNLAYNGGLQKINDRKFIWTIPWEDIFALIANISP